MCVCVCVCVILGVGSRGTSVHNKQLFNKPVICNSKETPLLMKYFTHKQYTNTFALHIAYGSMNQLILHTIITITSVGGNAAD